MYSSYAANYCLDLQSAQSASAQVRAEISAYTSKAIARGLKALKHNGTKLQAFCEAVATNDKTDEPEKREGDEDVSLDSLMADHVGSQLLAMAADDGEHGSGGSEGLSLAADANANTDTPPA